MSCCWRKAITVLVVVAVFYVFLSPVFVLDPSANRAWRAAQVLLLSIALIASLLFTLQKPPIVVDYISALFETRGDPDPTLLSSVCLC
jgi:hypothetical protein